MTNEMLQTNDTNTSTTLTTRLLVAMEMSLKNWRLVMSPEGGTRNRVKTVEAENYLAIIAHPAKNVILAIHPA
jgi:hypothetical protein